MINLILLIYKYIICNNEYYLLILFDQLSRRVELSNLYLIRLDNLFAFSTKL